MTLTLYCSDCMEKIGDEYLEVDGKFLCVYCSEPTCAEDRYVEAMK